jgi:dTDP-4-dehydrorhamnose reductase
VLVTGAGGMLGRALSAMADSDGWEVIAPDRAGLDVTDAVAVLAAVVACDPVVVIHAASLTDVDRCEREPRLADAVNARGTANVADACAVQGVRLVVVSTDLVFGGAAPREGPDGSPRAWRHDDETAPSQVYGRSKLAGEVAARARLEDVVVARTAVLAGPGPAGFVAKVAARALAGTPLTVVDDVVGSPTFVDDLVPALLELAAGDVTGVVHRAGQGHCSRHELAVASLELLGLDVEVAAVHSSDLGGGGAPRPAWTPLDQAHERAAGLRVLPHWRDGLARYLASVGPALRAGAP